MLIKSSVDEDDADVPIPMELTMLDKQENVYEDGNTNRIQVQEAQYMDSLHFIINTTSHHTKSSPNSLSETSEENHFTSTPFNEAYHKITAHPLEEQFVFSSIGDTKKLIEGNAFNTNCSASRNTETKPQNRTICARPFIFNERLNSYEKDVQLEDTNRVQVNKGLILKLFDLFDEKKYEEVIQLLKDNKQHFRTTASRLQLRHALDLEGKLKKFPIPELIQRQRTISKCFECVDMKRRHIEYWYEEMNTRFKWIVNRDSEGRLKQLQEELLNEYGNLASHCYNYHFFIQAAKCFDRMIQLIKHLRNTCQNEESDDSVEVVKLLYMLKAKSLRETKSTDERIQREARAAELSAMEEYFMF